MLKPEILKPEIVTQFQQLFSGISFVFSFVFLCVFLVISLGQVYFILYFLNFCARYTVKRFIFNTIVYESEVINDCAFQIENISGLQNKIILLQTTHFHHMIWKLMYLMAI